MQESEAFNELWGEQVNLRCHPQAMTPIAMFPETYFMLIFIPPRGDSQGRRHYVCGLSVHPPGFLVNMMSQELVEGFSSNFAQVFTMTQGWTDKILAVIAQRSRSLWYHICLGHVWEHNISRTPWGNFIRFVTKVHLDSRMTYMTAVSHTQILSVMPLKFPQVLLSWSYQANFWLPLNLTAMFSSATAWDLTLLRKCRPYGRLLRFHEDKQDNGICSANWISRTVRLLAEVRCLSWFSRGNTNRCIFPVITSCWSGKETYSTNRTRS